MNKLLMIAAAVAALANGLASAQSEPPLLIDQQPAPAPLDANS